jgi:hypothetical protein
VNNYIVGVLGKKGSGKTFLTMQMLKNIPKYIVLDVLHEYNAGMIFTNFEELHTYLCNNQNMRKYRIIFRPERQDETDIFLEMTTYINDFTLVMEEADFHCNPHKINEYLEHNLKYGRHYNRNLIWVSRRPFEVNRMLTAQSDLIIVFGTTEPRDLQYLSLYTFDKDIEDLGKYEYAYYGDENLLNSLVKGKKEEKEEKKEEKT